jgi:hypothetical protein
MTSEPNLFMDEHIGKFLKDELKEEGEKRANILGSRSQFLDETLVPIYPRGLWLDARLNFVLMQDVACIFMCSAALEAALKDYLGQYFRRKLKAELDLALDEMEIRALIAACESLNLIDATTIKMIRKIGDIRNTFVHSKIRKITDEVKTQLDKEEEGFWKSLDPLAKGLFVSGMAGEGKSHEALELLTKILRALFEDSEYYKW